MKKAMSFLLALVMALSLLPGAVWADNEADGSGNTQSAGTELPSLTLGENDDTHTVYFASGKDKGILNFDGHLEVRTTTMDGGRIPGLVVTGGQTGEYCFLAVSETGLSAAPTLTYRMDGEKSVEPLNENGNYAYQLERPEVTGDNTTVDFTIKYDERHEHSFALAFRNNDDNPGGGGGNDGQKNFISKGTQTENGYIIEEVKLPDNYDRPTIELNPRWANAPENLRLTRIGFDPDAVSALSNSGKEVLLYNNSYGVQFTLSHVVLADIAQKLSEINADPTERKNPFWVIVDYTNRDAQNGAAYAVQIGFKLGDETYTASGENRISVRMDREVVMDKNNNPYSNYALYCPNEDNTELVKRSDMGFKAESIEIQDMSDKVMKFTFSVRGGGMFVISPKDYSLAGKESFWGGKKPEWRPGGSTPSGENVPAYLQTLYSEEYGYKFPEFGKDFHLWFPKSLKVWEEDCGNDWDYNYHVNNDTGIVTVYVNPSSSERWRDAIEEMKNDFLSDGVYFGYYFGNNDNNGNPTNFGFGQHSEADRVDLYDVLERNDRKGTNLSSDYHSNNAEKMVALNKGALSSSIVARQGTTSTAVVVALDNESGKTTRDAAARYALQIDLVVNEDLTYKWYMENGTLLPTERMEFEDTINDGSNWEAIKPEAGTVFAYQKSGNYAENADVGTLTVTAPGEGYSLEWSDSNGGKGTAAAAASEPTTADIPLKNCYAQKITLRWKKGNSTVVENVTVEYCSSQPWMALLGEGNIESKPQPEVLVIPADVKAKLKEAGISVTYDERIGYFSTSVDAAKLTADNLDLLNEGYRLDKPERFGDATHYKLQYLGGSENPATHGTEWANNSKNSWADQNMKQIGVDMPDEIPGIPYLDYETLKANGLTVFYTDYQLYRGFVVQWIKTEKTEHGPSSQILGYSYVYGRNGVFETSIDTDIVNAVDVAVTKPTLEGNREELQFTCDKNPQTGSDDGRKLFLQFDVRGNYGDDATVYLPYSMFGDLTWEKAQNLPAPTITHYLDSECTISEEFRGEYTPYGVKFTTKSFSPFVIDCSAQNEDNGSSGNRYYYTGSGSTGTENTVTSGADQTKQAGDIVKVTVKSGSAKVQTVYVDGVALKAGDYIISGGTIKLQGTYTVKLAQGSHTLKIVYDNGSTAAVTFTLKGTTSPKTGDMGIVLYAALGVSSALGTGLVLKKKRK